MAHDNEVDVDRIHAAYCKRANEGRASPMEYPTMIMDVIAFTLEQMRGAIENRS